jgi:hypothetical protein
MSVGDFMFVPFRLFCKPNRSLLVEALAGASSSLSSG